jgi:hypothetical protein
MTYLGKRIFQIHKSSAILIHCLGEKFCESESVMCNFWGVYLWSIYHIFPSWNKRFSFRSLFLEVAIFSVSTIALTQKATKLCVAKLLTKQDSNDVLIPTNVPIIFIVLRGPNFILVTHSAPKIKLVTLLNELGKISPLISEGQFTTHVTEGVRMI